MPETAPHAPLTVRPATPADRDAVSALLKESELPLAGIPHGLEHFFIAESGGELMGAIGLEQYGIAALLRSAVVRPSHRGTGAGASLVRAVLAHAASVGVEEIGLLTTTAEHWFPRFGFERTDRTALPAALFASAEFQGACPETAVAMRRRLKTED